MRKWIWSTVILVFVGFLYFSFTSFLSGGLKVGDPLPPLRATFLDGSEISLDAWRGQSVVLRFSSIHCAACADDFELLNRWQEAAGDQVRFVAVQAGDTVDTVRRHLTGRPVDVPVVVDPTGDIADALGIRFVPAVVFVTSRGTLSSVSHNEMSRTDMNSHINLALSGGPTMDADIKRLSLQVRCMECEGRSVWESDAPSSIEMRRQLHQMLLDGYRHEEVLAHFEDEYGPWILMAPPARGFGALAWVFPVVGLTGGVIGFTSLLRRARRRAEYDSEGGPQTDDHQELARKVDKSLG